MSTIIKEEIMLTTKDNPYDPFTQFEDWYNFDSQKGYLSYCLLDRIANINEQMTLPERNNEYDRAMKAIVSMNPELYSIVRRNIETDSFTERFGF